MIGQVAQGAAGLGRRARSFRRHLAAKFQTHNAEIIQAGADVARDIAGYRRAAAAAKDAAASKALAAQRIQSAIGHNLGVATEAGVARWKEQAGRTNYKQVAEELADQLDIDHVAFEALKTACSGAPSRVLRVSNK